MCPGWNEGVGQKQLPRNCHVVPLISPNTQQKLKAGLQPQEFLIHWVCKWSPRFAFLTIFRTDIPGIGTTAVAQDSGARAQLHFLITGELFLCVWCVCMTYVCLFSRHMEVPRLGVKLELQPLAYTTATATPDTSCIFDLHHRSQRQILSLLNETRDRTSVLLDPSQIRFH